MRKVIFALILAAALLTPRPLYAEETCVSVYGGGVVCGAKVPEEHKPVETGLGENLALVAGGLLLASSGFFYLSKRVKTEPITITH